jgi:hypothetical protein
VELPDGAVELPGCVRTAEKRLQGIGLGEITASVASHLGKVPASRAAIGLRLSHGSEALLTSLKDADAEIVGPGHRVRSVAAMLERPGALTAGFGQGFQAFTAEPLRRVRLAAETALAGRLGQWLNLLDFHSFFPGQRLVEPLFCPFASMC